MDQHKMVKNMLILLMVITFNIIGWFIFQLNFKVLLSVNILAAFILLVLLDKDNDHLGFF